MSDEKQGGDTDGAVPRAADADGSEPASEAPPEAASRRRPALLLAAILVVVVAVTVTVVLAIRRAPGDGSDPAADGGATSGSAPSSPTSSPSDDPTAAPTGDPDNDLVADTVQGALDRATDELADPADGIDLTDVATGTYLSSLEAQAQEFEANGWYQEGAPQVDSVEILSSDLDATPPTVQAALCIDSSTVQILDESGQDLRNEGTPDRSLNVITLVQEGGTWKISEQTFGDELDC